MGKKNYLEGPTILFVDDDVGNLKVLQIHLSRDFKILVSQNATEALGILEKRSQEIGLVIADQRMPGITGTEFLVKVRQLYPGLERMIITAYADLPPIIEAINDGQISGYISKPWNPTAVRVILRGGIERFCLRRSLEEANLKLLRSEQNSVLGFLAAGIGHEINNPAAVILLNLNLLSEMLEPLKDAWFAAADPEELPSRQQSFQQVEVCIADSQKAVELLSGISRDLRILSRLDHTEELSREPTDVNSIIKRSLGFMHKQIEYRGGIQQNLGATCKAFISPSKLTQVLINLCTNAIHALDEVKDDREKVLTISSWDDPLNEEVQVEIEDNGKGIPKDVFPRIFDAFFTTKTKAMGLGLGLAISKNVIEQMGGRIKVRSVPDLGTSFTMHFPMWKREGASEPEALPEVTLPSKSGYSVLVIDDDVSLSSAMGRTLESKFRVETVFDGSAGIEALQRSSFDAILCDLMMPPPDGRDIYEYLKKHKSDHLDRLLFITGGTFTPKLKEFFKEIEGKTPVLMKPFTFTQLYAAIGKLLPASQ